MGKTKVFLRQPAFDFVERIRAQQWNKAAVKVQAIGRRFLWRCRYLRVNDKIIKAQAVMRRFLARKRLQSVRQARAAQTIQKQLRMYSVRKNFVAKKAIALWFQRMQRGKMGRKRYAELYKKHKDEAALEAAQYKAAVTLQGMARTRAAKKVVSERRKEKSKVKESFYGDSEAVKILKRQRQAAALQADKHAAIAKETARLRNQETDTLRQKLIKAEQTKEAHQTTREELISLRNEKDMLQRELAAAMAEVGDLKLQLANERAENKKLKEQMKHGVMAPVYTSTQYDDFADLKALDERLNGLSLRAKQDRKELDTLVQSLAILQD
mmetsp:Transcript_20863/g.48182  ORF Transcript_20863/g.48182 Transcript_20863/m.48182 type:complete len:325 (-) Transcript_20863:238-1212(-)